MKSLRCPMANTFLIASILVLTFLCMTNSSFAHSPHSESVQAEERVLIGFKDGSGWQAAERNRTWVRESGGMVRYSYRFVPAVAAKLPKTRISKLRADPRVAYIEADVKVHALDAELDKSWGVKHIDAGKVHPYNTGSGVKVAIIDTGIDYDHPDLSTNYHGGYDFANDDDNPMDDNGHGTHCAGIIAALDNNTGVIGVAPQACLYSLKVLDSGGSGYVSNVIAGIQWAVDNGIDIISMSFGSNSHSRALQNACNNAYGKGLILVAAAGNDYSVWARRWERNTVDYPARYDSVIAVGATDKNNNKASWSSTGSALELAAPGVSIYSTYWNDSYTTKSGTSMACPHVAGVAALILAGEPGLSNAQVRTRLQQTADDLGSVGRDKWYGYGLVDADEAAPGAPGEPPVAEADGPYSEDEGRAITFNGSGSYDPDGTITTYEWDWESDGTYDVSTSSPTIEHTWNDDYSGTVTLKVTDDTGMKDTDASTVSVKNVAPTAEAGEPYSADEGSEITLSGSATDPGADTFTYAWDLDNNGSYETPDKSVTNIWASDGTYTVGLQVIDDDGGVGTDTATVNIADIDPVAAFSYSPASPAPGESVQFTNESESYDGIISWSWDFDGDGTEDSTNQNPEHTYTSEDKYIVLLTVSEADGDSSMVSKDITATTPAPPPTLKTISVIPMGVSIQIGSTQQYTATGTYSDGITADITTKVTWASSASSVATIDPSGLATAMNAGTTTITATLDGVQGSTTLTVTEAPVATTAYVNIEMSKQSFWRSWWRATATITIREEDAFGAPIGGTTVEGYWTGNYNRTMSSKTNGSGKVSFITGWIRGTGTVTFTVDRVTKDSQEYFISGETEDSISGP